MTAVTDSSQRRWMFIRRGVVVIILLGVAWAMATASGLLTTPKLRIVVGDQMPKFGLASAHDQSQRVTLKQFQGKGLLLNFTATQCKPCENERAVIRQLHQRYAGRYFAVASISDEKPAVVSSYVDYHKIEWPVGLDKRSLLRAKAGIDVLPTTIFIGPTGKVSGVTRGRLDAEEAASASERLIIMARKHDNK